MKIKEKKRIKYPKNDSASEDSDSEKNYNKKNKKKSISKGKNNNKSKKIKNTSLEKNEQKNSFSNKDKEISVINDVIIEKDNKKKDNISPKNDEIKKININHNHFPEKLSKEDKEIFFNAYELYLKNDGDSYSESDEKSDSFSNSEIEDSKYEDEKRNMIDKIINKNNNYNYSNLNVNENKNEDEIKNEEAKKYFTLGINTSKINENNNIRNSKLTYGFIEDELVNVVDDHLFFNGFEYYKIKQYYQKQNDKNKNFIYFRCRNYRKDERNRVGTKRFCDGKIEFNIESNINPNKKFRIISDHSLECYNYEKTGPANNNMINDWEDFTNKCFNYLNNFKGVLDNTVFSRILTKE